MYNLKICGDEKNYKFNIGENLLDILQSNGIILESPCGGKGLCGKCKVIIVSGKINEPSIEELKYLKKDEFEEGIRLSCLVYPEDDISIKLLDKLELKHEVLTDGYMPDIDIEPTIHKKVMKLIKPTLDNNISYEEIFERSLGKKLDLNNRLLLNALGSVYEKDIATLIYSDDELIGIESGDTMSKLYGVAVDIGTTTVVAALIDLNNGEEIASKTAINPQKEYGLDVLSRIDFVKRKENGLYIMHRVIIDCLNSLISDLCLESDINKENIYEMAVGANATMMHFLLCIDTNSIGKAPYSTVFSREKYIPADSIGIKMSPFSRIYCLPGVSSFIGADIVAGAVVADLKNTKENVLFIDIGTNGEIILSKKGTLTSCSCAAGPALEGANISCGMRAAEGAIEGVKITQNGIKIDVIGNKKPIGICGSGILEIVSEMWRNDIINKSGRLKKREDLQEKGYGLLEEHLVEENKKRKFILCNDEDREIIITQEDIRQVQLAKGAISSGFYSLLELMDINMDELSSVVIAGQFGKHLKVESLIGVGIIPESLREKVKYIGNSSKTGALMCLLSKKARKDMEYTAKDIRYFELSTKEGYEKLFTKCITFG